MLCQLDIYWSISVGPCFSGITRKWEFVDITSLVIGMVLGVTMCLAVWMVTCLVKATALKSVKSGNINGMFDVCASDKTVIHKIAS